MVNRQEISNDNKDEVVTKDDFEKPLFKFTKASMIKDDIRNENMLQISETLSQLK